MQEPTHDRSDEPTERNQPAEPARPSQRQAPEQPAKKPKDPASKDPASKDDQRPTLPDRPFDETDAAWGDYPHSSDDWLREQRPPHYE